jgi:putative Mg2+ transporter-C (MgtC) family protein
LAGILDFTGQGWLQLAELTLAFALSALVGLEREIRQKSAVTRCQKFIRSVRYRMFYQSTLRPGSRI